MDVGTALKEGYAAAGTSGRRPAVSGPPIPALLTRLRCARALLATSQPFHITNNCRKSILKRLVQSDGRRSSTASHSDT
jgi:hypothetical protein